MVISDLPQEILIEIFSRLPAKSVGRCRCLAKFWLNLFSSPQFIKSHRSRKPHQQNILLIHQNCSVLSISDAFVSRRLESLNNCTDFMGSHDGLVLLVDKENAMILVNPITQQQMKIPDSPLALNKRESFRMYGFGYDRISDDYKIVTLSNWYKGYYPDCVEGFVDVYSVKGGFWKRLHNSPYDHISPCGVFLNGAIHWLSTNLETGKEFVMVAFDLAAQVFDEIPTPSGIDPGDLRYCILVVVDEWLCLADVRYEGETDVWIMKEYGVGESWTKLTMYADIDIDRITPLRFVEDEEMVFLREDGSLNVYNVKEKTMRKMVVDGVPSMEFTDGATFIETLVSPCPCFT